MHLKSLELRGFKTFADKTVIELDPSSSVSESSITAVVGPNGCGKSNLVDGLRWVSGEQSVRELRGEVLAEVIFAGSAARKPLSLAEVTLTLDNTDHKLPLDYSEVTVRRRIFRSGESEFFINRDACRLKDIRDLFLDTGTGASSYSVISQGQVDQILSSRPEDRREIFEEAARIGKYRFRRRAAERKLFATEQNLLRVTDLKAEISRELGTLEEQSRAARAYLELKDKLKSIEVGFAKRQLESLARRRINAEAKIEELRALVESGISRLTDAGAERDRLRQQARERDLELEAQEAALDRSRENLKELIFEEESALAALRNRWVELKGNEKVLLDQIRRSGEPALEKPRQEILGQLERLAAELAKLDQETALLEEKITRQETEKNAKVEELARCHQELAQLQGELTEKETRLKLLTELGGESGGIYREITGVLTEVKKEQLPGACGVLVDFITAEDTANPSSFLLVVANREQAEALIQKIKADGSPLSLRTVDLPRGVVAATRRETEVRELAGEVERRLDARREKGFAEEKISEEIKSIENALTAAREEAKRLALARQENILRQEHLRTSAGRLTEDAALRQASLERASRDQEVIAVEIERAAAELDLRSQKIKALTTALSQRPAETLPEGRPDITAAIEALDEKIKRLMTEDRETNRELGQEEIKLARLEGELSQIEQHLRDEYNMTREEVLAADIETPTLTEGKQETDALRANLRSLEPVNLLSIEEFDKTKERLAFIEKQTDDLREARENLLALMKELDASAREKFKATIETVGRHFSEIYGTLFEGGEARLSLTDDADILEAGIEIMARPYGKKWLNLSLLSGGERALTAIAILFALLRTHPAPFCFLDEVDAALDEANILRFNRLLKDFSRTTQIIIITHSKATMAMADTLYGVTMEEPGVSRVVSMKLAEAA